MPASLSININFNVPFSATLKTKINYITENIKKLRAMNFSIYSREIKSGY